MKTTELFVEQTLTGFLRLCGYRLRESKYRPRAVIGFRPWPPPGATCSLVGVELVHVPYVTQGPPHLLDDLHLFERRLSVSAVACTAQAFTSEAIS
jgi:hypothetical protein